MRDIQDIFAAMNDFKLQPAGNSASEFLAGQSSFPQRILVVEDEGDLRQLNAEVLVDAGYQVDGAEDGAAAWAALQSHHYDLLLTDQFLPKLSGVELLKKIHTARMTMPLIMATSTLQTWDFALHLVCKPSGCCAKPIPLIKCRDDEKCSARNCPSARRKCVVDKTGKASLPLIA